MLPRIQLQFYLDFGPKFIPKFNLDFDFKFNIEYLFFLATESLCTNVKLTCVKLCNTMWSVFIYSLCNTRKFIYLYVNNSKSARCGPGISKESVE